MGDIKRKRKAYTRPRQLFDRKRIDEENLLIQKYGLKNKREIWKAKSLVSKFRRRAKYLIGANDPEEQRKFFEKLTKLGIAVTNISDVLALEEKHLLDRRLQTFVNKKELANTPNQARQLIVHKHILVDGNVVNIPSFWVTLDLENKIEVKPQKEKPIVVEDSSTASTDSDDNDENEKISDDGSIEESSKEESSNSTENNKDETPKENKEDSE